MLVVMATTVLAILLAGMGILAADSVLFQRSIRTDLTALSSIIADNLTASLMFDDPPAARETLATLRARAHVVCACAFKPGNILFATYARNATKPECPLPQSSLIQDRPGELVVSRPILMDGKAVGSLVVVYDRRESSQRIEVFGGTVIAVLLLSTLIALAWSARLRSLLTMPVVELARVTTEISRSRDYGIRAKKYTGDELGLLVDTFNEMLASIQLRDDELAQALAVKGRALHEVEEARKSLEATIKNVARLNADLSRSNESLARSNEDLERFAFVASHDLQEPLRMIGIHSQLISRNYAEILDQRASKWIETIDAAAKRMRLLLADLLAYAEIGAPSEAPGRQVDLNEVVQKAKENLSLAIAENDAVVVSDELPALLGYESHFIPLFQNLIGNAIKYRAAAPPVIRISAASSDGRVQICVADNGIGIAPEYHAKIFIPFKRLHGATVPGTGIGLAICQRVVEKYGGRIWVESDGASGSSFYFTLRSRTLPPSEGG